MSSTIHCLSADRDHLLGKLELSKSTYYYEELAPMWHLIVLDAVDVFSDRASDHRFYQQAVAYLETHKGEPNTQEWNSGMCPEQLNWLQDPLRERCFPFYGIFGRMPHSRSTRGVWEHALLGNLIRTPQRRIF